MFLAAMGFTATVHVGQPGPEVALANVPGGLATFLGVTSS